MKLNFAQKAVFAWALFSVVIVITAAADYFYGNIVQVTMQEPQYSLTLTVSDPTPYYGTNITFSGKLEKNGQPWPHRQVQIEYNNITALWFLLPDQPYAETNSTGHYELAWNTTSLQLGEYNFRPRCMK